MPTFRPIESNSLRFIWEEDPNLLQTDKNRLYNDYTYAYKYELDIKMQVLRGDDLWLQIRTDYDDFTCELIKCDNTKITLSPYAVRVEDNFTYYQIDIDTSALDGFYCVRFSAENDPNRYPICHFISDWFEVLADVEDSVLIEWYGSNANEIPMQWDAKTQQMRLRANVVDYLAGQNLSTMIGSDNNIVTLVSDPLNQRYLNIDNITEYLTEKINIAISHDYFFINGQRFKTEEAINIGDRKGDTMTYSFQVKIQEYDYLNYASDREITGELPEITETSLAFDSETSLAFDSETSLKFM